MSVSFLFISILVALLSVGPIMATFTSKTLFEERCLQPWYTGPSIPPAETATQFLEQNIDTSTPFDRALDKYRRKLGIAGHLLEPNLVRHVGAFSTFGEAYDHKFRGQRELEVKYQICA